MTKDELKAKIVTLELAIEKSKSDTCNVISELDKCKKDLTDLSKPKLTSQQYEAIHQAVECGIGEFDFDDTDNYSIDYGIEKVLGRPLSQKVQEGFFRIGMFLLLSLMFFTTLNDLKDLGLF